jgi:ankyrin repeat protein
VRTVVIVVVVVIVVAVAALATVAVKRMHAHDQLFAYAVRGDAEALRSVVTADNVNATDKWGWTPLMVAAAGGHEEACNVLLAAGADAARKDRKGFTALDYVNTNLRLASPEKRERTAAYLKEQGINIPGLDLSKAPPLDASRLLKVKALLEGHQ